MSINLKTRSPFLGLILILIMQLSASVSCFYFYYKFQTIATTRSAANERLETKFHDINCDRINKEVVIEVMKGSVTDAESMAEIFLNFGIFIGWTAGFALLSLLSLRKKYVANSPV